MSLSVFDSTSAAPEVRAVGDTQICEADAYYVLPPASIETLSHFVFGTAGRLCDSSDVQEIELDGQVIGHAYSDEQADYSYLGGVWPSEIGQAREAQVQGCFERIEAALAQVGMEFRHVVRTWLFLDRLLDWYGPLNAVRTSFFEKRGVFDHLVPASTGIGTPNPAGAALIMAALAINPKTSAMRIQAIPSPLQCPALDYHSSFSRAVEVARPGLRQLYISGTASIGLDGKSLHLDDPSAQIDMTMRVIEAILQSRRMDWSDTTRMTAYFTDLRNVDLFKAWCRKHDRLDLPAVFARAVVCRADLLFEVELDAASERPFHPTR